MNKIIKQVNNNLHCYVGETLKDEPQGNGELEIYWPGPEIHKKVLKQIDPKWEKNNQGKDEIDYLQENYGSLDDGLYVVNKKAFTIKDGKVFKVDLDKVTG